MAALGLALGKIVEPNAQHPGGDLEHSHLPPVALLAKIGGNWLGLLLGEPSPAVEMKAQCLRKAFLILAARDVAGERLAVDDRGEDPIFTVDQ